ncbi:MAG: PAS domain S-box protein [Anaerolineales bacterium]|nr:PAS domain S-box protein [Anaerolineales bacterium]
MNSNFPILFLLLIAALSGLLILFLYKKASGTTSLMWLTIVLGIWTSAYFLHETQRAIVSTDIFIGINNLCLAAAATFFLFFTLAYSNRRNWINPYTISLLLIEPALTQILFWDERFRTSVFDPFNQAWEHIHVLYILHLLAGSLIFLIDTFARKPRAHFFKAGTILFGALIPILGTIFISFEKGLEINALTSILAYSLGLAGVAYGKFNSALIEAIPLTREAAVESMDDGWMVVDEQGKVIDMNSAAERLIESSREKFYGQPITRILTDWDKLARAFEGIKEMDFRRSMKMQNDWRYLNIRVSQLSKSDGTQFGHLVIWRDITEKKLAEDARQQARDELFVLLNAISSAASRSLNLDEFLSQSIYQILYSFKSQAAAIFLSAKDEAEDQEKLTLHTQFGLPPEQLKIISNTATYALMYNLLIDNEENRPLIVNDLRADERVPFNIRNLGFNSAVLIPLVTYAQQENTLLGCLCLSRIDDAPYTQDEVIRLTTIANQIATLIESARRRQNAIVATERQRLLRDLHDSVSQKLYGLVALTEAAQAGIEAGSKIAPLQVLTRIGENARQAVKEMRLFLYEMQPVDLKDGLISALHHRLAAVEGRADIKARLLADENIKIPKYAELALYFITQEALNNTLRHAHAKNVLLTLKQSRQNITLEIEDDGDGFKLKEADAAGLGLKNMRERALLIHGKFKMTSKVGKGTKISVTISRKG